MGTYLLVVGVYDRATMKRLLVKGAAPADTVLLGYVNMVGQN